MVVYILGSAICHLKQKGMRKQEWVRWERRGWAVRDRAAGEVLAAGSGQAGDRGRSPHAASERPVYRAVHGAAQPAPARCLPSARVRAALGFFRRCWHPFGAERGPEAPGSCPGAHILVSPVAVTAHSYHITGLVGPRSLT